MCLSYQYFLILLLVVSHFSREINYDSNSPDIKSALSDTDINESYKTLNCQQLDYDIYRLAFLGFQNLKSNDIRLNDSILTIIDYRKPSTQKRIFILDLKNFKVLYSTLVAHGKSTGELYARSFSNMPGSHKSSLGFFMTDETYYGKHGYSLRIIGLEKGINDNALKRAIVFHGASYVSEKYIDKYGRIGRSFGCPALPEEMSNLIIDQIRNNTCLFIYGDQKEYISTSGLITSN